MEVIHQIAAAPICAPADATEAAIVRPLSICIINPKFETSYWGYQHALPLLPGRKMNSTATGALPALAALTPAHCHVELIDENVEDIDFADLARFDVIGVTGMIVQHKRMEEILARLKSLPVITAVGGPYISVAESLFVGLCDARFIGEAEDTWPAFVMALSRGEPVQERYEQADRTDMHTVPPPRYDLLKADRYVRASLQFSRGCPFMCEFCDIITVFGRRPRMKTPEQMLVEFDGILAAGFTQCFLVDDNFIGNKKMAKELLRALISWQEIHDYPILFSTEASIDLAEDAEMLELMVRANMRQVFIGLESPRAESLKETRKTQNVRGDSLLQRVQRVRDAGLVIAAGFIVGFDNDDESIFQDQFEFIQASGIAIANLSILTPIPTTPLHKRLLKEGRLDFSDPIVMFHPAAMSREQLKIGHARLLARLYTPDAYFDRLLNGLIGSPKFRQRRAELARMVGKRSSAMASCLNAMGTLAMFAKLALTLAKARRVRALGSSYLKHWRQNRRALGQQAIPFGAYLHLCVEHWHFYNIAFGSDMMRFGSVPHEVAAQDRSARKTIEALKMTS